MRTVGGKGRGRTSNAEEVGRWKGSRTCRRRFEWEKTVGWGGEEKDSHERRGGDRCT